jgi:hyperosmotically inducible protein
MKRMAIRTAAQTLLLAASLSMMTVGAHAQASDSTTSADTPAKPAASGKQADRALARSVRRALGKSQGVDPANIYVRARGGAVTLSGTVADSGQIATAGDIAKGVSGVQSVSNKLSLFHGGNG